jgi:hypothetical protein
MNQKQSSEEELQRGSELDIELNNYLQEFLLHPDGLEIEEDDRENLDGQEDGQLDGNSSHRKRETPGSIDSQAFTKKKKKRRSKTTKKEVPPPPPPPPLSKKDVRKVYSSMLLNTFNSCDTKKLHTIMTKYAAEDVVEIHRYDGVQNPFGRNFAKISGRAAVIQMWETLFRSAPDFFYTILDSDIYHAEAGGGQWKVTVSSAFKFKGTRIADIHVAKLVNSKVLEKKLGEPEQFVTDEEQLLKQQQENEDREQELQLQISAAKSERSIDSSKKAEKFPSPDAPPPDPTNPSDPSATITAGPPPIPVFSSKKNPEVIHEPLFGGEKNHSIEASDGDTFYLDAAPLAEKLDMRITGSMYLTLNKENKIEKIEFVFKAVEEDKSQISSSSSTRYPVPAGSILIQPLPPAGHGGGTLKPSSADFSPNI